MKIHFLDEPLLQFGNDYHVCPRFGISNFETYDSQDNLISTKPKDIVLGVVGTNQNFESFDKWIGLCSNYIAEKESKQPNLFTSFCGFNEYEGLKAKMVYNSSYFRQINDIQIKAIVVEVTKTKNVQKGIKDSAELYLKHIEFLATDKTPKVIICIIPDLLWNKVLKIERDEEFDRTHQVEDEATEINFRSYLKAKSMQFKVPIQIMRERSLSIENSSKGKSQLQDLATRAWNFCTAIYYKAGGIPWKANVKESDKLTCYVGISFFRSLDKRTLQTSLAQVFDEQGRGLILRGSPVEIDKSDKQPHLSNEQAYDLLVKAIEGYHFAEGIFPKRVVIHKSSRYTEQELEGFITAINDKSVNTFDFVTVLESDVRLFRSGSYPPLRGTMLELTNQSFLLYTKSAVDFYKTYAGMYIPEPIEIRIAELNSNPRQVCEEVLALTKMNWNKTQFDGKMPITIDCSRSVGAIMKYLTESNEKPEKRYCFYM
jgi:hypothetical protein